VRALGGLFVRRSIGSALVSCSADSSLRTSTGVRFHHRGLQAAGCAIFKMVVREPRRGRFDASQATPSAPAGIGEVMRMLARKPSFWGCRSAPRVLMMGTDCSSGCRHSCAQPRLSLLEASLFFGAILLLGGIAACGSVARWQTGSDSAATRICYIRRRHSLRRYRSTFRRDLFVARPGFLLLLCRRLGSSGSPVLSSIQHVVPPNMRTTASRYSCS